MKRIAIFCDGTWNAPWLKSNSSIERGKNTVPAAADMPQKVIYVEGIGTCRQCSVLGNLAEKLIGGLTGTGLNSRIRDAYTQLVESYEIGDEIYIFGFSRGAYTARSLAGLIRKSGIVSGATDEERARNIDRAIALYRYRVETRDMSGDTGVDPDHPDAAYVRKERLRLSATITSAKDLAWRKKVKSRLSVRYKREITVGQPVKISYLGVYDTVGALGIPGFRGYVYRRFFPRFSFHDPKLTSMVQRARHAMAVDETRLFFEPTGWTNLPTLNNGKTGDDVPYQQRWFPGTHAVLGGTAKIDALSVSAFHWIMQGACEAGLVLDDAEVKSHYGTAADPSASMNRALWANLPWEFGGLFRKRRALIQDPETKDLFPDQLSDAVCARVAQTAWRPRLLERLRDQIPGWVKPGLLRR
jgi:uncharacterized protein (DUF2235 family)